MKERSQRKEYQKKLAFYSPSSYSQQLAQYLKNMPNCIEPLLRPLASISPLAPSLPLLSILKATCRLFLLTPLELLLVSRQLEETEWDITHPFIVQRGDNCRQLFCSGSTSLKGQRLSLLLMLVCYWAKQEVGSEDSIQKTMLQRICPSFSSIFKQWINTYPPKRVISPRQLNTIFKVLSKRTNSEEEMNLMVDQIVHLSHTYHMDKKAQRKQSIDSCSHSPKLESYPGKKIKTDLQFSPPELPIEEEEEFRIESLCLGQKQDVKESQHIFSFLNSSYSKHHPLPSFSLQGMSQADCDYIEVGLGEGESAGEFMVMKQGLVESVFFKRVEEKQNQ